MSDRDALIAAILANPDEDTPRLMFTDPARAEFIRSHTSGRGSEARSTSDRNVRGGKLHT